jgi:hypothetical protein
VLVGVEGGWLAADEGQGGLLDCVGCYAACGAAVVGFVGGGGGDLFEDVALAVVAPADVEDYVVRGLGGGGGVGVVGVGVLVVVGVVVLVLVVIRCRVVVVVGLGRGWWDVNDRRGHWWVRGELVGERGGGGERGRWWHDHARSKSALRVPLRAGRWRWWRGSARGESRECVLGRTGRKPLGDGVEPGRAAGGEDRWVVMELVVRRAGGVC